MTGPTTNMPDRLYGMLLSLLSVWANKGTPPDADPRGIVQEKDALDAVMALGAEIDAAQHRGELDHNRAAWMAALLMVIREHIRSLPRGLSEDEQTDLVNADLVEMVDAIRRGQEVA